jgi:hypothetical protein
MITMIIMHTDSLQRPLVTIANVIIISHSHNACVFCNYKVIYKYTYTFNKIFKFIIIILLYNKITRNI